MNKNEGCVAATVRQAMGTDFSPETVDKVVGFMGRASESVVSTAARLGEKKAMVQDQDQPAVESVAPVVTEPPVKAPEKKKRGCCCLGCVGYPVMGITEIGLLAHFGPQAMKSLEMLSQIAQISLHLK